MAKLIKMAIYGEPGVGKSTFAAKAPKPFFITTDGNYEYLEDFCGSKPEDHVQVSTWKETKVAFARNFDDYDTIVVDLVEDTYMWAENEFCKDNAIRHISDLGYGKGYGLLGNEFFIEYQRLLALPKNIILILHGVSEVLKDRRGVEYTKYGPSKLVREKIITQIEGRVRFFLRAFAETSEDENANLVTQRYLSLSPDGMTEYGITRGLSGDIPRNIPLDWNIFYEVATKNDPITSSVSVKHIEGEPAAEPTKRIGRPKKVEAPAVEKKTISEIVKEAAKEEPAEVAPENNPINEIREKLKKVTQAPEPPVEQEPVSEPAPVEEAEEIPVTPTPAPAPAPRKVEESGIDKMAAIKAKMAALKGLR